jgi:hypothetical protein
VSNGPYITRVSAWAPGIENSDDWDEWAHGRRNIASDGKGPAIAFTDSMFRRRLSQISKMTVQVVYDLLPVEKNTKFFFVSFRGELSRYYQINKMLAEEKTMAPAAFSFSVFNAPAALASIALGLKGGYSALYPGNNSFASGLAAAEAAFLSGTQDELIFVYADEQVPPEYGSLFTECPACLAFGLLLTRKPQPSGECRYAFPLSSLNEGKDSPSDFLRRLLLCDKIHVSP